MAITSIHSIDATIEKAIDYILDGEKTDNGLLVSTFACTPDGKKAAEEFEEVRKMGTGLTTILGKHLVQCFEPGEITPELSHQIGLELCEKLLGNRYQYVLATHIDKEHIHNHIIFNEVNFDDFRSFEYQENRGKDIAERIRIMSDELCEKYGLSVIKEPEKGKGKSHYEWEMDKAGMSWKSQLKNIIDETITESSDFDDFLDKMREKEVEVVYRPENKITIKFRLPDQQRFARGKTLGWYYDEPQIRRRIEQYQMLKTGEISRHKKSRLIDTSQEKFQESKGLQRWAEIRNMQEASKLLNLLTEHNVNSREELEERSLSRYADRVEIVGKLNSLQHDISDLKDVEKLIKKYIALKPVNDEYKRTGSKGYAKENEKELRQFDTIKNELISRYPNKKIPRLETLRERQAELITERNKLNEEYKRIIAELKELDYARRTISEYLDKAQEQKKTAEIDD